MEPISKKRNVQLPYDANSVSQNITSELKGLLEFYSAKDLEIEQQIQDFHEACSLKLKADQVAGETIISDAKVKAEKLLENAKNDVFLIESERASWLREKEQIASTYKFDGCVKLDVGGSQFTTTVTSLRRFPDTMIGAMFSGRHEPSMNKTGDAIFIDRDGTHFRYILNFLRDPEGSVVSLTDGPLAELKREAEYYGLLDYMFPFVPALDTIVICNFGLQRIISQDKNGLWYTTSTTVGTKQLLTICKKCNVGYFIDGHNPRLLGQFALNREISVGQPVYASGSPCYNCNQW